jgi:hypothetical protein
MNQRLAQLSLGRPNQWAERSQLQCQVEERVREEVLSGRPLLNFDLKKLSLLERKQ